MSSILFATPCYGGMVTAAHFRSCLDLKQVLMQVELAHDWLVGWNDSHIVRIRNEMATKFLEGEHSHLFWLDADIKFTPEDVAKIWNLQADVGVGCYAMKKREEQWFAAWKDGKLVKDLNQFNGPVEVDLAGTGFMCISRKVLETLAKTAESYETQNKQRCYGLFMSPVKDDMLESEDYNFCRRAREAGFKIILDPTVRLGHIGQFTYGEYKGLS